jgi:uncharacterized protein (DUF2141 family)
MASSDPRVLKFASARNLVRNCRFLAELRLAVDGIRSDSGDLLVALYDSADGFRSAIANAATRGPHAG